MQNHDIVNQNAGLGIISEVGHKRPAENDTGENGFAACVFCGDYPTTFSMASSQASRYNRTK